MNLKDRFNIKLDPELRKGQVKFDDYLMSAKVLFFLEVFILMYINIFFHYSSLIYLVSLNPKKQLITKHSIKQLM